MENLIEAVQKACDKIRKAVANRFESIKNYFKPKTRPQKVTSVSEFLEQKKRSEPFYKSAQKNRKPWE